MTGIELWRTWILICSLGLVDWHECSIQHWTVRLEMVLNQTGDGHLFVIAVPNKARHGETEENLINSIDSRSDPTLSWLDYSWNKLQPWQDIQTCGAPLYETPLTRGSLYTEVSNVIFIWFYLHDFSPISLALVDLKTLFQRRTDNGAVEIEHREKLPRRRYNDHVGHLSSWQGTRRRCLCTEPASHVFWLLLPRIQVFLQSIGSTLESPLFG